MTLVAGVDSSTQSTKIVVCAAATGEVVRSGRAPHPDGTEVDPESWWRAYGRASDGILDGVEAISVGGQQHGMVLLDDAGRTLRPALLWNDVRSAAAARELVDELGGPATWAEATGSVPGASFTVTKLRWVAEHEPAVAQRASSCLLPHDWLTWRLADSSGIDAATTDRGDASGTGYWSPRDGAYRHDLVVRALGHDLQLPRVAGPYEVVGRTGAGIALGPGTGDNMAAALGLMLRPGDVVVSLGTSGTAFACTDEPTHDAGGDVAGFADAAGRFLPLVCTLNAARVLDATAALLGTTHDGLDQFARQSDPGAGGLTMLPYLDGERTPDYPDATGSLVGLTRSNMTPEQLARAAIEGVLCGLADGVDALVAQGVPVDRVLLIGGAARSSAVQEIAAMVFDRPVAVPSAAEYVALGAARQAAWALAATPEPPDWQRSDEIRLPAPGSAVGIEIRDRYAQARHRLHD